jgi:indole-3-glycerol phosphate synthase
MNILDEIFIHKRAEVDDCRRRRPLNQVRRDAEATAPPLDFISALRRDPSGKRRAFPALIAEVKRASPSRGVLIEDFDPLRLARIYQENGAAAISVLTDEYYFQGSLEHLAMIAKLEPRLPLLRKDFTCDPYQVYEARAANADAMLLIAAYLDPLSLRDLHSLIHSLGMAALVEVHTRAELESALAIRPSLVGINNRDLRDFTVRLETTLELSSLLPEEVCLVAESGIHTPEDVVCLGEAGVDAILVGEALVKAKDIGAKVRSLAAPENPAGRERTNGD